MKKKIKIVSMILMVLMVITTLTGVVNATSKIEGQIQQIGQGNSNANADKVVALGATVVTIMQTVRYSSCSSYIINPRC